MHTAKKVRAIYRASSRSRVWNFTHRQRSRRSRAAAGTCAHHEVQLGPASRGSPGMNPSERGEKEDELRHRGTERETAFDCTNLVRDEELTSRLDRDESQTKELNPPQLTRKKDPA